MRRDCWADPRATALRSEHGYSLIEMMIAAGAAAVIGVGLYAIFNANVQSSVARRQRNEVQTNCTFALDQIKSELSRAGFRATHPTAPITAAASNSITFEYWDDNATTDPPFSAPFDNHTRVTYRMATVAESPNIKPGDLVREFRRFKTGPGGGYDDATMQKQVILNNVRSLGFSYMQSGNSLWTLDDSDPTEAPDYNFGKIRTIQTALICESRDEDPILKKKTAVALTAEVRARNVGIASMATDNTPPAAPTGLVAWDPGTCGTLQLRWNSNTEADLDGYMIFYGLSPGAYSRRVRIERPPSTAGHYEYFALTGLTSNKVGPPAAPAQYYIALQAFDKSGNLSYAYSPEATGNPVVSTQTESAVATNGSDTAIDPQLPSAPTSFSGMPTPGVHQSISLSWTAPAATELVGFRIYRGTSPTFTPDNTPVTGNLIASETHLPAEATSYADTGTSLPEGHLIGCLTYYYKISAVLCDPSLVASYTAAQFATASAAPTDGTAPVAPVITAKAGYRRIIIALTNPVLTGDPALQQIDPDWVRTELYWSPDPGLMSGTVPPTTLIPQNGGIFTPNPPTYNGGFWGTINFNDTNSPPSAVPNLTPDTTYYMMAIAYDRCNNQSNRTLSSVAKGTQCGDCLDDFGAPDPVCYGAPPTPSGLTVQGCYGVANLSWNPIDDMVNRDFQGFRVLRREGASWVGGTNEVSLTGNYPAWITSLSDTGIQEGQTYSYRVMATDCYYENHAEHPADPWPEPGNNPADNYSEAFLANIAPGRPILDSTKPQVVSGALGATPPWFYHNPVTFWMKNTGKAQLTLKSLSVNWDTPDTFLQKIVVGDGNTTPVTTGFDDATNPLTHGYAGSTVTFDPTQLDPLDAQIPLENTFLGADRGVTATTDMRAATLEYALTFQNTSTGTDGCSSTSRPYAPLGPYIYSVYQDKPYIGTLGWPVPGEDGVNFMSAVVVPGSAAVNIYADILDASGVGIDPGQVRLYYFVDPSKTLMSAPPVTGTFPSTLNYTLTFMTHVGGDQWVGTIPAHDDANIWYFIVARDTQGNFDRNPEPWAGALQYYQMPPNDCTTIPNPPTLSGTADASQVVLTWLAPTTNATPAGVEYLDAMGYAVWRQKNGGTPVKLATIASPATLTYSDTSVATDIQSAIYSYYVTALDRCTPTANASAPSASFTEQIENDCSNRPNPPHLSGTSSSVGGSVTLTWTVPTMNAPPSVAPLTDLAGYEIWRQRNTAGWLLHATIASPATLTYTDSSPTSNGIRTNIFEYYVKAYDSCTPTRNFSDGSTIYRESETWTPCDAAPNPPTGLAGSASAAGVTLTWVAPTQSTDGLDYLDAAGYAIERSGDGGGTWVQIGSTNSTTLTYTDTDPALLADIGTVSYSYRVRAVDVCPLMSAPSSPAYTENYSGPCASIPSPPAISGNSLASGVNLNWVAPTTNATPAGLAYTDPGGYRVYRRRTTTGSWVKLGADLPVSTTTYLDTSIITDIGTVDYYYYVSAIDTCAPTPNESAAPPTAGVYNENYTDPCAGLTVPGIPLTLTAAASSCTANGGKVTLNWSAPGGVAPDGYRVYGCTCTGTSPACACTPATLISTPDPLTVRTYVHTPGGKLNAVRWRYGVKSVNKGSCTNSTLWQLSPLSNIEWDRCTPQ